MQYQSLEIPDVMLLTPTVFGDERGYFMETFRQDDFVRHCGDYAFVQDNHSKSGRGVLRGLHYQLQRPQGKLVRLTRGAAFDVAVDLRRSSPTFGRWVGTTLSDQNRQMLWIPPGFAHGFYVISEECEFLYKCTDYYLPDDEYTLRWDDGALGIHWPLLDESPKLSSKDQAAPALVDCPSYP